MIFKMTRYSVQGDEVDPPVEEWFDSLPEVAQAIIDHPEWEGTLRNLYIDWVSV